MENTVYKYETKSLDVFATLLALGAEIERIDKITDPRFYKFFLTSNTIDLEKQAFALASKTLMINAHELLDAHRRAKSLIHSTK